MIDYNNKIFRSVTNTASGEVSADTVFHYFQNGSIVTAVYSGGSIVSGQLIAVADEHDVLDMRYQHVNSAGQLMTGICRSVPELLPDGRIRLYEQWQWTSGGRESGSSVVEEV